MSKATEVERLSKLILNTGYCISDDAVELGDKIVQLLGNYFSTDELEDFNNFVEDELE